MKKSLLVSAFVIFAAAILLAATDLTGTWNATVNLGDQGGTPSFVLKQDGDKLTGTYKGALGEAPLTGTLKGSDVTLNFEVQGAKVVYTGKVDADGQNMKGTCDYGGQASGTFTATKAKAEK